MKTIYVQLKNSTGTVLTTILNDSINYTAPAVEVAPTLTSITINNGATTTSNNTISVGFNASGTITEYILSESSDFSNSTWQTYTNPTSFLLSGTDGLKTIYAKLRNSTGESSSAYNQITLDTSSVVDELTASINSSTISAVGGNLVLTITSNISWTIVKNAGTLNYTFSSMSGTGNATITITVAENTSTTNSLTGSFVVSGNSISVPISLT